MQSQWQELIEQPAALAAPENANYLLIDQGRWPDAFKAIYRQLQQPELNVLFGGTLHQPLMDLSPVLLRLPAPHERYQPLFDAAAANRAGIALASALPLTALADHFRDFLLIAEGDGQAYYRFYDPAVWLGSWLAKVNGPLCEGITRWWVPDWCAPGCWREQKVNPHSVLQPANEAALAASERPKVWPIEMMASVLQAHRDEAKKAPVPTIKTRMSVSDMLETQSRFAQLLYSLPPQPVHISLWLTTCMLAAGDNGYTEPWEWQPWYDLLAAHPEALAGVVPSLTPHFFRQPAALGQLQSLLQPDGMQPVSEV